VLEQLDGSETDDDQSDTSSDILTMVPAREFLRRNVLTRNAGESELNVGDDLSDAASSASGDDVLTMLPASQLEERFRNQQTNEGQ